MTLKYFFSLYKRNVKEVAPIVGIASFAVLLVPAIIITILLPFTFPILGLMMLSALSCLVLTPILSLIKTGIDWNTRKFTPKEEIPGIIEAIEHADADLINKVCEELITHKPQSKSSRWFLKLLRYDRKSVENEIEDKENQEKERLLDEATDINFFGKSKNKKKKMLDKYKLDQANQMKLDTYCSQILIPLGSELHAENLEKARIYMKYYIKDENNNGKKTFQRTAAFFQAATMKTEPGFPSEEKDQDFSMVSLKSSPEETSEENNESFYLLL